MEDPPRSASNDGLDRLESAMELWLRFQQGLEGESKDEFLSRHADLDDLLLPMFDVEPADEETRDVGSGTRDSESSTAIGRTLGGDFQLRRELGRGGMGVVYEAHQASLDRLVAVKILSDHPNLPPKAIARFRREAITAARLEHKGIVQIFETGEDHGVHWFAMERIAGEPLDIHVATHLQDAVGRDVRQIVELIAEVADALHHAHAAGVLHRDIKPSNILVRADGTPVLTDFGLAREEALPSLTHSRDFAGTPYYVSPEQVLKGAPVDARSDVFSLGVTLYELLTSERPFRGDTTQEVLAMILHRDPADPQRINPNLNRDLSAIVMKALEKDPSDRYASAAAFAEDLRHFLAFRPVAAKRASVFRRGRRWVRREPVKASLILVLALAIPTVTVLTIQLIEKEHAAEVGREELTRQRLADLMLDASRAKFQQDLEGAERAYQAALQLAPEHPMPIAELALHYGRLTREGKMFDAAKALAVLDGSPDVVARERGLRRIRAMVLRELGRGTEADAIDVALGEPMSAMEHFVVACQGLVRVERGDDTALQSTHRALVRATLRSPEPNPAYLTRLFVTANLVGDEALEKEVADSLVHLWPESPTSWIFMTLYWYGRDVAKTREAAEQCLKFLPGNYWARFKLGETKDVEGDLEGAIADYEAAWQAFEGDGKLAHSLGSAYARKGDFERALEFCKQAALLHSIDPETWQSLGDVLAELDMPKDVMKVAMHMQRTWPQSQVGHWLQADAYALRGRTSAAVRIYERAIERSPGEAGGHGRLARLLLDDDRFDPDDRAARTARARIAARRAVELTDRGDPAYLARLAEAEFRSGDPKIAREIATEALRLMDGSQPRLRARLESALLRYR